MNTLLLDRTTWDLCLDAHGNIALASNPYSIAQDAASAMRLFEGELYYDTSKGVPYFQTILGHHPPLGVLKAALRTAALSVPETTTASVFISDIAGRAVSGQVQIQSSTGTSVVSGPLTSPTPG